MTKINKDNVSNGIALLIFALTIAISFSATALIIIIHEVWTGNLHYSYIGYAAGLTGTFFVALVEVVNRELEQ